MDKSTCFLWVSLLLPLLLTSVSPYVSVSEDILCRPGSQEPAVLGLELTGNYSAVVVEIRPRRQPLSCPVALLSPPDHVLTVRPLLRELPPAPASRGDQPGSCSLQVTMSPSAEPYWFVDLCNRSSANRLVFVDVENTYGGLLSWNISEDAADSLQVTGLLFTVVKFGDECSKPGMVSCLTTAFGDPVFCVSPWLACDGNRNCPTNSWDERPETCSRIDELRRAEGTQPPFDVGNFVALLFLVAIPLVVGYVWVKRRLQEPAPKDDNSETSVYFIAVPEESHALLAEGHLDLPPSYEELDQPPVYFALYPQQPPEKTHSSA